MLRLLGRLRPKLAFCRAATHHAHFRCLSVTNSLDNSSGAAPEFRFAVAESRGDSLSGTILDCCAQLHVAFGGARVDFCQLFVSLENYEDTAVLAPKFLHDVLPLPGHRPPLIIGGAFRRQLPRALQSDPGLGTPRTRRQPATGEDSKATTYDGSGEAIINDGSSSAATDDGEFGISVMAASLPGVELHGFRIQSEALPALSSEVWSRLLAPPPPGQGSAMLVLAEPHFLQVERVVEMVAAVAPHTRILGGVVDPAIKGPSHSKPGLVFLGPEAHRDGAVGAALMGPLRVDATLADGCRRFGPEAQVTSAGDGGLVTELDGEVALLKLREMYFELPEDLKAPQGEEAEGGGDSAGGSPTIHVALDESGSGRAFKTRNVTSTLSSVPVGSVRLAVEQVAPGSLLQLCVRDPHHGTRVVQEWAQDVARRLHADHDVISPPSHSDGSSSSDGGGGGGDRPGSSGNVAQSGPQDGDAWLDTTATATASVAAAAARLTSKAAANRADAGKGVGCTSPYGALVYSCLTVRHGERQALETALPGVPVQGAVCHGEFFAPGRDDGGDDGTGALYYSCSALGVLSRQPAPATTR